MDLSCGSVSSDELDPVISSSTGGSGGRILQEDGQFASEEQHGRTMHSQDARSATNDNGKPLTPAQELRKATKPLMEKRRRARINQCLQELKDLILEALNKDPARHNKLEKADILEMAVCHLKSVQRQVRQTPKPPLEGTAKYRDGYTECANEVSRFVNNVQVLQPDVKQKLIGHLSSCINTLDTSNGAPISPSLGYPLAISPTSQLDQQVGPLPVALPSGDRSSSPLSYSPYPPLSPSSHRSSPPLPAVAAAFPVIAPLNLAPSQLVAFPGMIPPPTNDLNNNNVNNNVVTSSSSCSNSHQQHEMSVGLNLVTNSDHRTNQQLDLMTGCPFGDEPMEDENTPAASGSDDIGQSDAPLDFSKKLTQIPKRTGSTSSISSSGLAGAGGRSGCGVGGGGAGPGGGGGGGGGANSTVFPNPRKKYLASVSSGASSSSDEGGPGTTPHGSVSSANELDFSHHSPALHQLQQQQLHQNQPVNYSKNVYGGASAPRYNFLGVESGIVSEDDDDVWRPWHFQR